MAHIKKFVIWFDHKRYDVTIGFWPKFGNFHAALPERLQKVVGAEVITSKTLAGVENQIKDMVKLAEAKGSKNRKVIIFSFTYDGKRPHPEDEGRLLIGADAIGDMDNDGLQITLWWHVAMERLYQGKKTYFRQSDEDKKAGNDVYTDTIYTGYREDSKVLPWTAEREKFFQSLDDSMVQAIQRLIKFAHTSPKKIAAAIDAGQRPLLGKGKD